jgi:hypothetical protein
VVTAEPRDTQFVYKADADGWYFFVVQTEDLDGRRSPTNVHLASPGLRVCVDTVRPQVSLRPVLPQKGTVAVEWEVRDDNIDLRTLKLEYRAVGLDRWTILNIRQPMARAQFGWDPVGTGPFEVRLQVSDLARNTATATTQVTPGPGRPVGGGGGGSGGGTAGGGLQPRVIFVRSKTFKLNYELDNVGPSNVKRVEVWMTHDTKRWERFLPNAPAQGPCELTVKEQGRYGFTLLPVSGVDLRPEAPRPGQQPQIWVHVDEKPPVVNVQNVRVGTGAELGTMTIHWRAEDAYLRPQPITIQYATDLNKGDWQVLQKDVDNASQLQVSTKELPFQFYIRIEATDEAGNKGSHVWKEPVKVDLRVPTIKSIKVDTGTAPGGAEAPQPSR